LDAKSPPSPTASLRCRRLGTCSPSPRNGRRPSSPPPVRRPRQANGDGVPPRPPPHMCCPVPVRRRKGQAPHSARACLVRWVRLSICNASLHNNTWRITSPLCCYLQRQSDDFFAQVGFSRNQPDLFLRSSAQQQTSQKH